MTPKRISQRERALTVYFKTVDDKKLFASMAAAVGMTASKLGGLLLDQGLRTGYYDQLKAVLPAAEDVQLRKGVKSRHSPTRPPRRKKAV